MDSQASFLDTAGCFVVVVGAVIAIAGAWAQSNSIAGFGTAVLVIGVILALNGV
jgi:hypothetical protein